MATYITVFLVIEGLLAAIIILAGKNGSKSEKLEALKKELKQRAEEQERANRINENVGNMPIDDVRDRLQNISDK
jgi:hypothetical protein